MAFDSLGTYARKVVRNFFKKNGYSPEETALFCYWKKIVGDDLANIFSITKIQNVETSTRTRVTQLHLATKDSVNSIEISYIAEDLKTKISDYFGYELVQEIKIKKGIKRK